MGGRTRSRRFTAGGQDIASRNRHDCLDGVSKLRMYVNQPEIFIKGQTKTVLMVHLKVHFMSFHVRLPYSRK